MTKPLDRYLSPLDVWAMAFGCMVGWGVFAMPGTTFLPVAGPAGTLIAMLIGMVIMLIVARNISYLMGRTIEVMTAPGSGTEIVIRLKFRLAEEDDVPDPEKLSYNSGSREEASEPEVDFSTKRLSTWSPVLNRVIMTPFSWTSRCLRWMGTRLQ